MKKNKKTDFEVELLPIISVLAICISFLLLTAVWIQYGFIQVKQGMGADGDPKDNAPSIWVSIETNGDLQLQLKDFTQKTGFPSQIQLSKKDGQPDLQALANLSNQIKTQFPDVNMAMILPSGQTSYENLISVMDEVKKANFSNVGIAPL